MKSLRSEGVSEMDVRLVDTDTAYDDLYRCPDCGSVLPDRAWIRPKDEEDETCPICGWHGASIPVMVLKKKWTETLVYIEEE
jgi:predicted RNA-binding Zn-ribbon protein involved in translation (DUF1610 family)